MEALNPRDDAAASPWWKPVRLAHLVTALGWIGVAVVVGVLALTGFISGDPGTVAASYIVLDTFAAPCCSPSAPELHDRRVSGSWTQPEHENFVPKRIDIEELMGLRSSHPAGDRDHPVDGMLPSHRRVTGRDPA